MLTHVLPALHVQEEPRRLGKAQGWLPVPEGGGRQLLLRQFEVCERWSSPEPASGVQGSFVPP